MLRPDGVSGNVIRYGGSGVPAATLRFVGPGDVERMRIAGNGAVGIGTATPTATLHVVGTVSATGAVQVGTSGLACSAGIPGAIRYNGGSLEYCNGSAWTALGGGSTNGSGAANHIAYWSGVNTLAHDANQLYWDAANNRMGIGTNNPSTSLQVQSTYPVVFLADSNAASLGEVGGRLAFTDADGFTHSQIGPQGSNNEFVVRNNNGGPISLMIGSTKPVFIDSAGRVSVTTGLYVGSGGVPNLSNYWSSGGKWLVTDYGVFGTNGGYESTWTWNGYRNNASSWTGLGVNGFAHAAMIAQGSSGILFFTSEVTPTGQRPDLRMAITPGGNVGIGTATPYAALTIGAAFNSANRASGLLVRETSDTSIGTGVGAYVYPFEIQYGSSANNSRLQFAGYRRAASANWQGTGYRMQFAVDNSFTDGSRAYVEVGSRNTSGAGVVALGTDGVDRVWASSQGVGVGKSTPLAALDVNGSISASSAIQVGTSSLTCGAGIPGAMRYSGGNLQYCNGSSWTSLSSSTTAGTSGSGAANHIAYWTGSDSLAHDANQLYWDASNNRLGVGLNNPNTSVAVAGAVSASQGVTLSRGSAVGQIRSVEGNYGVIHRNDGSMYYILLTDSGDAYGGFNSLRPFYINVATGELHMAANRFYVSHTTGSIRTNGSVDVGTQVLGNSGDSAATPTYSWTGDTNTGVFTPGADQLGLTTGGGERLRVTSGGLVGIGATAPMARLNVIGGIGIGTGTAISQTVGLRNSIQIATDTFFGGAHNEHSGYLMYSTMSGGWGTAQLHFARSSNWGVYDTGTPVMTLGTNVGIGTDTPASKLDVAGHTRLSGATSNTISWGTTGVAAPGAGSAGMKLQLYGATPGTMASSDYALGIESGTMWFNGGAYKWYVSANQRMSLDGSGNLTATAFLYSSDRRLKENIQILTGGLAKLERIEPVTFSYISDTTHRMRLGVMAQDVEAVYPEAVVTDAKTGLKSVDYPALVPVLIQSVKELKADNDNLRALYADEQKVRSELAQMIADYRATQRAQIVDAERMMERVRSLEADLTRLQGANNNARGDKPKLAKSVAR